MKKLVVTILTAALAAGILSAQELPAGYTPPAPNVIASGGRGSLSINGEMVTGFTVTKSGDEDATLAFWNKAFSVNRMNLFFNYTNSNYGASLTLRAKNKDLLQNEMDFVEPWQAFIWANFLDDNFKLSFGKLRSEFMYQNKIWKTEVDGIFFTGEEVVSARLEYTPKALPGLNVGFQLFAPDGTLAELGADLEESVKEIGFGAQYNTSAFNVVADLRLDGANDGLQIDHTGHPLRQYYNIDANDFGGYNLSPFKESYSAASGDGVYAFAGFTFKAVKGLTAMAQAGFFNIGDFNKYGYARIEEKFGYAITDKLGAELGLGQFFYGDDVIKDDYINAFYANFKPSVTYKLHNNFTPTLGATVAIAPDLVESSWAVEPKTVINLGGMRLELGYSYSSTYLVDSAKSQLVSTYFGYTSDKLENSHQVFLNVMMTF